MTAIQQIPPPTPAEAAPAAPVYYTVSANPGLGSRLMTVLLTGILVALVAIACAFLLLAASVAGWGGRVVSDAGQQAADLARSAAETAERAGQAAADRLDPAHPPRSALAYDAEIDDLLKLNVGQDLPAGGARAFSIQAIRSRTDESKPELARYVTLHSELRQPRETRVFGLTVRRDSEPRDEYLYQGEAFRIGGQVYKVNWISPERQQVALVQLRTPDRLSLPLKAVFD